MIMSAQDARGPEEHDISLRALKPKKPRRAQDTMRLSVLGD